VSSISSPTELVPHLHHELEPLQQRECLGQNAHQEASCLPTNPGIIYDYQEQAIKASFGHQEVRLLRILVHEPCAKEIVFLTVAVSVM
jgi:hypothetical protein